MRLPFLYLLVTLCSISGALEVLLVHSEKPYVVVSQNKENPVEEMDRLCVVRKKEDIACGNVAIAKEKYAVLRIDYKFEKIKKYSEKDKDERWIELDIQRPTPVQGDKVRLVHREPQKQIRELTSSLVNNNTFAGETISKERQDEIEIALQKIENSKPFIPVSVLSGGMNTVLPFISYQQAMSQHWGLGVMAMYMNHSIDNGNGSLTGPGLFLTYNHYSEGPLKGLWFQLSPGFFSVSVRNGIQSQTGVYQVSVLGTVGWRHFWKDRMNFGIGVGGQYLPFGNNAGGTGLAFSGFIPSVTIDAGIAF